MPTPLPLFTVDAHCDTVLDVASGRRRLGELSSDGHVDLPRLRRGGVNVQFFAAYIEPHFKPTGALHRALALLDVLLGEIRTNRKEVSLVLSSGDLEILKKEGKIGALLAIEGGECLEEDLAMLRVFYQLGVRSLGLTWNQRNALADGVGENFSQGGLSDFGRAVVREMNSLGMLVDVAHLGEQGFWGVLETSTQPVINSHANCRHIWEHRRNVSDAQLKAMAEGGGVVCITFAPAFLGPDRPGIGQVVRHLEHACEVAGVGHVGLGSDFDGIPDTPAGLEDVTCLPRLAEELLRSGFKEAAVRSIFGGNVVRVIDQVLGGGQDQG